MGKIIPGTEENGEWEELSKLCKDSGIDAKAVDAEKQGELANKMGVRGFPTCVLLKDNTIVKTIPGFRPAKEVMKEVMAPPKKEFKLNESGHHLRCFYTNWCGFSKKMMGPVIPGHDHPGEWNKIVEYCKSVGIKCTGIDAEKPENKELTMAMEVDGFPTCILFKDGKKTHEISGYRPANIFISELKKKLGHGGDSKDHSHDDHSHEKGLGLKCFYTNWCGYSKKMMGPLIPGHNHPGEWNKIKDFCAKNNVKCEAIDAEQNADLAKKLNVRGFPTCIVFKDGKPVDGAPGFMPADNVINIIKSHM